MKTLFIMLLFSGSLQLEAQENSTSSSPVIVAKIPLGETFKSNDASITFLEVLEDSRCPTDVTCLRAGQAKVIAVIKKQRKKHMKKNLFSTLLLKATTRKTSYLLTT